MHRGRTVEQHAELLCPLSEKGDGAARIAAGKFDDAARSVERFIERAGFCGGATANEQQQGAVRGFCGVGGKARFFIRGHFRDDDHAQPVEKGQRFRGGDDCVRRGGFQPLQVHVPRGVRDEAFTLPERALLAVFLVAVQQIRAGERAGLYGFEKGDLIHKISIAQTLSAGKAAILRETNTQTRRKAAGR